MAILRFYLLVNSNTHKMHGICSLFGEGEPLLYTDCHLYQSLLQKSEALLAAPLPQNKEKFLELCELAQRNFEGIKALLKEEAF